MVEWAKFFMTLESGQVLGCLAQCLDQDSIIRNKAEVTLNQLSERPGMQY